MIKQKKHFKTKINFAILFTQIESSECPQAPLDVIFLLDGSASVGFDNFEKVKVWTGNLAEKLMQQNKETHIGVIQYSFSLYIKTEVKLNDVNRQKNLHVNLFNSKSIF